MDLPGALRVLEVIVQDPGGANRGHCNVDVEIETCLECRLNLGKFFR